MGIFSNFKKPKPDDEFIASDEWLLGLSDDPAPALDALAGPNGHRPLDGHGEESDGSEIEPIDGVPGEAVAASTWHFPDLDADELPVAPPTAGTPVQEDSVPTGPDAVVLLEILGVAPGATWHQISAAHAAAVAEYDSSNESDRDRAALADALRREMNTSYAALRLLAVS